MISTGSSEPESHREPARLARMKLVLDDSPSADVVIRLLCLPTAIGQASLFVVVLLLTSASLFINIYLYKACPSLAPYIAQNKNF